MAKNILFVDDAVEITSFAKRALANKGYNVKIAYNGEDALNIAQSMYQSNQTLDLLISDTNMPFMDGPELIKECLALDKNIKILQMSGKESKVPEAHEFLAKPYSIEQLYEKVSLLLSEKNN